MTIDRIALLGIDIIVNAQRARTALKSIDQSLMDMNNNMKFIAAGLGAFGVAFSGFLLARRVGSIVVETTRDLMESTNQLEEQIISIQTIAKSDDIKGLGRQFIELGTSIRGVEFKEIESAGLAAARTGVTVENGLFDLIETSLKFAKVSKDLGSAEAAEGLAALAINFDKPIEYTQNLASGIDMLSDNFITTSGEILKTSARLSGFAETTGMTVEDLNGLSAALLSSRQSATVVRSTISQLLAKMTAAPEKVRDLLSMSQSEYERFFIALRTDPAEAILTFAKSLNKLDPSRQSAALVDMGLASDRTASTIRILQGAIDNVEKSMQISNEETQKGTALLDKYAVSASSANDRLQQLSNRLTVLKAGVIATHGVVSMLDGLLTALEQTANNSKIYSGNNVENMLGQGMELGKTVEQLNAGEKQIKSLQDLMRKGIVEEKKGFLNSMNPFSIMQVATVQGEINRLELFRNLIVEKRIALVDNEIRQLEEEGDLAAEKLQREKDANDERIRRERAEQGNFMFDLNRMALPKDEGQIQGLYDQITEITDKFISLNNPTDSLSQAFEDATDRFLQQIDDIEAAQLKKKADSLSSATGEFGSKVQKIADLMDLRNQFKGVPDIFGPLSTILDKQLNLAFENKGPVALNAFRDQIRMAEFDKGDTELKRAQLLLTKEMVKLMGMNNIDNQTMQNYLQQMLDALNNGGVIQ